MIRPIVNTITSLFSNGKNSFGPEIKDPLTELNWLNELKTKLNENKRRCDVSIFQAAYKNQSVIYTYMTDPRSDLFTEIDLLNYNGQVIKKFNFLSLDEFDANVKNSRILYSSMQIAS